MHRFVCTTMARRRGLSFEPKLFFLRLFNVNFIIGRCTHTAGVRVASNFIYCMSYATTSHGLYDCTCGMCADSIKSYRTAMCTTRTRFGVYLGPYGENQVLKVNGQQNPTNICFYIQCERVKSAFIPSSMTLQSSPLFI